MQNLTLIQYILLVFNYFGIPTLTLFRGCLVLINIFLRDMVSHVDNLLIKANRKSIGCRTLKKGEELNSYLIAVQQVSGCALERRNHSDLYLSLEGSLIKISNI